MHSHYQRKYFNIQNKQSKHIRICEESLNTHWTASLNADMQKFVSYHFHPYKKKWERSRKRKHKNVRVCEKAILWAKCLTTQTFASSQHDRQNHCFFMS